MDKIIIIDAAIHDAKAIRTISKEAWVDTYPNEEYGVTKEDLIARFTFASAKDEETFTKERQRIILRDKNQHYWVAELSGKVIGFCLAKKADPNNIVQALHVLPGYQGQGIGKLLMTKAMSWLGAHKSVRLTVVVYNQRAISFYEKLGFQKTGKVDEDDRTILPSGRETPQIEMMLFQKT